MDRPVGTPSGRQIDISVARPYCRELAEEWLRRVAEVALEVALPPGGVGQLSLLVADDATVQQLNREFRGLDEVTDVLSFSPSHAGPWEGEGPGPPGWSSGPEGLAGLPFVLPPDQLPLLGDVVVSYPQAVRQARAGNQPVSRELALLIVHGVLHLVGHEHLETEETAQMQAKERAALSLLFEDEPAER